MSEDQPKVPWAEKTPEFVDRAIAKFHEEMFPEAEYPIDPPTRQWIDDNLARMVRESKGSAQMAVMMFAIGELLDAYARETMERYEETGTLLPPEVVAAAQVMGLIEDEDNRGYTKTGKEISPQIISEIMEKVAQGLDTDTIVKEILK